MYRIQDKSEEILKSLLLKAKQKNTLNKAYPEF